MKIPFLHNSEGILFWLLFEHPPTKSLYEFAYSRPCLPIPISQRESSDCLFEESFFDRLLKEALDAFLSIILLDSQFRTESRQGQRATSLNFQKASISEIVASGRR